MQITLPLAKRLKEAGCELESEKKWITHRTLYNLIDDKEWYLSTNHTNWSLIKKTYPAYDILNEICVKYYKEFFSCKFVCSVCGFPRKTKGCKCGSYFDLHDRQKYDTEKILWMLQNNTPQQDIEDYIWQNCLFNKERKG